MQQLPSWKTSLEASLLGRPIVLLGRTIVLKSILPGRNIVLHEKLFHKHQKFLQGRTLLHPSWKARVYGTASCYQESKLPRDYPRLRTLCNLFGRQPRPTFQGRPVGLVKFGFLVGKCPLFLVRKCLNISFLEINL